MRFCWGVLPRFTPDIAFLLGCFASVHACCLPHSAKQDGLRYLAFLFRGSRSPFVRSRGVGAVIFLGRFTSGLCVYLWRSRRGCRGHGGCGERGTGDGTGCVAFVRLCAGTLALLCFPRGVRWGCAPQTAPKSLRLSGLSSRCGGVGLVRVHGLCALLRGHIGTVSFSAGSTLGLRAPDCAKESSTLWTLFRGWPSERVHFTRRGWVGADSPAVTRVHGKTRPSPIYARPGRAV